MKAIRTPECETSSKCLDFPSSSPFFPSGFEVLPPLPKYSGRPTLLKQWDDADLWFKKDDEFEEPMTYVNLRLYAQAEPSATSVEPVSSLFLDIWRALALKYLREVSYAATCAKNRFNLELFVDSVNFWWIGFADSIQTLVEVTLDKMLETKQDRDEMRRIFGQVKQERLREWQQEQFDETGAQITRIFASVMYEDYPEHTELCAELRNYTYEQFQVEMKRFLVQGRAVFYVYGNASPEHAISLVELVRRKLDMKTLRVEELRKVKTVDFRSGIAVALERTLIDPTNRTSGLLVYYQIGLMKKDIEISVTNKLL